MEPTFVHLASYAMVRTRWSKQLSVWEFLLPLSFYSTAWRLPTDFRNPRANQVSNSWSRDVGILAASSPALGISQSPCTGHRHCWSPKDKAHGVNGNTVWLPWIRTVSLKEPKGFLAQRKHIYSETCYQSLYANKDSSIEIYGVGDFAWTFGQ